MPPNIFEPSLTAPSELFAPAALGSPEEGPVALSFRPDCTPPEDAMVCTHRPQGDHTHTHRALRPSYGPRTCPCSLLLSHT